MSDGTRGKHAVTNRLDSGSKMEKAGNGWSSIMKSCENVVGTGRQSVSLCIVSEAPTPHNNYLFEALATSGHVAIDLHYIYDEKNVPGRPWASLDSDIGSAVVRTGISRFVDWKLIRRTVSKDHGVFFVIGWNHLSLVLLIFTLGMLRRPLLMWFDTPRDVKNASRFKALIKRLLIKSINRSPGVCFVTGGSAMASYREMGIHREKLCRLPFFTRRGHDDLTIRESMEIENGNLFILAGGRLISSKGYDLFIKALQSLMKERVSGWKAVLVGSGPESESLRNMAADLGVTSHLRFIDWCEPKDFANFVEGCDIFVAPARFDPFPTTVISAMQAGKVVLATDGVGSAVEFIESGVNGVRVPTNHSGVLAEALLALVEDTDRCRELGQQAEKTLAHWQVSRGVQIVSHAAKEASGLYV